MADQKQVPVNRLDVPLVWERGVPPAARPAERPRPAPPQWSRLRLWIALLADAGAVLLALAAACAVAAALGASLTPPQLVAAGLAGLALAAVTGVGTLWGWRGTPGMVLLRLRLGAPLDLAGALRVWLLALCCLPLAGLPLLLGRRGHTPMERLAGGDLTLS